MVRQISTVPHCCCSRPRRFHSHSSGSRRVCRPPMTSPAPAAWLWGTGNIPPTWVARFPGFAPCLLECEPSSCWKSHPESIASACQRDSPCLQGPSRSLRSCKSEGTSSCPPSRHPRTATSHSCMADPAHKYKQWREPHHQTAARWRARSTRPLRGLLTGSRRHCNMQAITEGKHGLINNKSERIRGQEADRTNEPFTTAQCLATAAYLGSPGPHSPHPDPPSPSPQFTFPPSVPSTHTQPAPLCAALPSWEQPTMLASPCDSAAAAVTKPTEVRVPAMVRRCAPEAAAAQLAPAASTDFGDAEVKSLRQESWPSAPSSENRVQPVGH